METSQLHLLHSSLHFGALVGSRSNVPLHSGQEQTPSLIMECQHVGCGQRLKGMPPHLLSFSIERPLKSDFIPSNRGLL